MRIEFFDRPQIAKLEQVPSLAKAAPLLPEQVFDAGVLHNIKRPATWLQQSLDEAVASRRREPFDTQTAQHSDRRPARAGAASDPPVRPAAPRAQPHGSSIMALYIVRIQDNREAVAVLAADTLDALRALVDEVCDPTACEVRTVAGGGGVFFENRAPELPRTWTDDGGPDDPDSDRYIPLEAYISEFTAALAEAMSPATADLDHPGDADESWHPL